MFVRLIHVHWEQHTSDYAQAYHIIPNEIKKAKNCSFKLSVVTFTNRHACTN